MATHTAEHDTEVEETDPGEPGRPSFTGPLFTILAIVILAVFATQVLGRAGEDYRSFSASNAAFGALLPALVAAAVAWAMPRRHGWRVRLPIALIAAIFVLFVAKMWPVAAAPATGEEAPAESTTLL